MTRLLAKHKSYDKLHLEIIHIAIHTMLTTEPLKTVVCN